MNAATATDSVPAVSPAPVNPAPANPAPLSPAAGGSAMVAPGLAAADGQSWLTAVLRPAGWLDPVSVRTLGAALGHLAAATDMIVVDLAAADVRDPRAFAAALAQPAAQFERAGGCLLVTGASRALTAELARAAVPVVALAVSVIPAQAAARALARAVAPPAA